MATFNPSATARSFRARAEVWGFFAGCVCGVWQVAWVLGGGQTDLGWVLPVPLSVVMVMTAVFFVVTADWKSVPVAYRKPIAARAGVSIGAFLLPLAWSILFVVASLGASGRVDHPLRPWVVTASFLFCVLPVLLVGIWAAGWSSRVSGPGIAKSVEPSADSKRPKFQPRWVQLATGGMVLLGLASLALPPASPPVRPGVIRSPGQPAPPVAVAGQPAFVHALPEGFREADARRVEIVHRRGVNNVQAEHPFQLSPDGKRLAVVVDGQPGDHLAVYGLAGFDLIESFPVDNGIVGFSWSPQSDRLFVANNGSSTRHRVLDLASRTAFLLPPPPFGTLPTEATFEWVDDGLVVFSADGDLASFDLETFSVTPTLRPHAELYSERRRKGSGFGGTGGAWRLELAQNSTGAFGGGREPQPTLRYATVFDPERKFRKFLEPAAITGGGQLALTPDRGIIVRQQGGQLEALYLGLGEPVPSAFTLETGDLFRPEDMSEDVQKALADGRLHAYVAAAVTNPLNQRIIGPDREIIYGSVRFRSWEGGTAEVEVGEFYQQMSPGQVAFWLHWDDPPGFWVTVKEQSPESRFWVPLSGGD